METGEGHSHMRTRRDTRPRVTRQILLPSSSDEDLYSISDETDDETESDDDTRPDSLPDEEAVNNEEEERKMVDDSQKESNRTKALEIPMRWANPDDGCIYGRRKVVQNRGQTSHYMYCTAKQCKAGFVCVMTKDGILPKWNGKEHNHPIHQQVNPLDKNREQVALRQFVREHSHLESRQIYSLILKRDPNSGSFPPLDSITVKLIDNLKGQIAGSEARYTLSSLVPGRLQKVNGAKFIAVQTLEPLVLILATDSSLKTLRESSEAALLRLKMKGNIIEWVYCVYAVVSGRTIPTAWILFNDKESTLPWVLLKWVIGERVAGEVHSWSRVWNIPGYPKYLGFLEDATRANDHIRAISGSYERQINKHAQSIVNEESRREIIGFFETEMSRVALHETEPKLTEAENRWKSDDERKFVSWWRSRFEKQTFLYSASNRCEESAVVDRWLLNKRMQPTVTTDGDLIAAIHEQYKEAYRTSEETQPTVP